MKYSTNPDHAALVGGEVREFLAPADEKLDPYLALDQLMSVVEALCPTWPARPPFIDGGVMRL